MNEIVSTFSLAWDTFISEMHLRQSGFTCRAGGSFVKNKERTQKFNGTGDL